MQFRARRNVRRSDSRGLLRGDEEHDWNICTCRRCGTKDARRCSYTEDCHYDTQAGGYDPAAYTYERCDGCGGIRNSEYIWHEE